VRVAYRDGFSAPVLPDPSADLGDAESPPPPSGPVREGTDETGDEEMEAYRGEPWFRDPYVRRPADHEPDREMEAYRNEPWFRDPYARQPPACEPDRERAAYRNEPRFRDPYARQPPAYGPDRERTAYRREPRFRDPDPQRPPEYEPDPLYRPHAYVRQPGSRAGEKKGRRRHTGRRLLVNAGLAGAAIVAARLLIFDQPGVMATVNSGVVNLSDHLGRLSNGILDALWSNLPI
jgi:hypothetical protein